MNERVRRLSARAEFWVVVSLCFLYFVATSLAVLLLRVQKFQLTTGRTIRGIVTETLILAVVSWFLHVRGWQWSRISSRLTVRGVLLGIPLFIGYYLLYWFASALVVASYPAAGRIQSVQMVPAAPFGLIFAFLVINSLFEETTVAAYVISALSEQGAAFSITASTLLRFAYHLYQGPVASVSIVPLGLLFGTVYFRTRNVWPLVTAHTIANVIAFSIAASRAS
jgi:membrane protease YdiL (CAAX protease family)